MRSALLFDRLFSIVAKKSRERFSDEVVSTEPREREETSLGGAEREGAGEGAHHGTPFPWLRAGYTGILGDEAP